MCFWKFLIPHSHSTSFLGLGAFIFEFFVSLFSSLGCLHFQVLGISVYSFGCLHFRTIWMLHFRVLSVSFSSFGCFIFEFWVFHFRVEVPTVCISLSVQNMDI